LARRSSARARAALLSETTCPRCGVIRTPSQAYCLECGLRLPSADDGVAALRRGWLRTIGWYPGDFVWMALAGLVVAAGGAAAAIAFQHHRSAGGATTFVARAPATVAAAAPPSAPNGRTTWPANRSGWTVVLLSSPATKGAKAPAGVAKTAARDGLPDVGVLDSSSFGSLHPGYLIVFSGYYTAPGDASAALATVRTRGFGGAYVLRVVA
jgi:hypothetical protein